MAGNSVAYFPKLVIDSNDVFGSWDTFIKQFDIEIQFRAKSLGTKTINNEDGEEELVEVFNDDMKCLALFRAIGIEGMNIIEAAGYSVRNNSLTYEEALTILQNHYGREESIHVKTRNFVCVTQNASEDDRDYLKRVEQLSRNLNYFKHSTRETHTALQAARQSMSLVIAVNGLRDTDLRKELMAKETLTWEQLSNTLTSRSTAKESAAKLELPINSSMDRLKIKKEVAATTSYSNDHYESARGYGHGDRVTGRRDESGDRYSDREYGRDRRDCRSRYYSSRRSQGSRCYSRYYQRDRRDSGSSNGSRGDRNNRVLVCYECEEQGHIARFCPWIQCYKCLANGHMAIDCNVRNATSGRDQHSRSPGNRGRYDRDSSPYPERGRQRYDKQYIRKVKFGDDW